MLGKYDRSRSGVKRNHLYLLPLLVTMAWLVLNFFVELPLPLLVIAVPVIGVTAGLSFSHWQSPACPECGRWYTHTRQYVSDDSWELKPPCAAKAYER